METALQASKSDRKTIEYTFDIKLYGVTLSLDAVGEQLGEWIVSPFGKGMLLEPKDPEPYKGSISGFTIERIRDYAAALKFCELEGENFTIRIGVFVYPENVAAFSLDLKDNEIENLGGTKGCFEFNFFMCDEDEIKTASSET